MLFLLVENDKNDIFYKKTHEFLMCTLCQGLSEKRP